MSLSAWQSALVELVSEPRPTELPAADSSLTDAERAWLLRAAGSPGLRLTRTIQRSWRRMRLQSALRFTWSLLPQPHRDSLIEAYLDARSCTSFFDVPEACAFLEFALPRLPPVAHLESLCRFERALLASAAEATFLGALEPEADCASPSALGLQLEQNPAAALVTFAAPLEDLLETVLLEQPLPPPESQVYPVLIAPRIPHHFRTANSSEVAVAKALTAGPRPLTALRFIPDADTVAAELLRVEFLRGTQ